MLIALLITGCTTSSEHDQDRNGVVIHQLAGADMLNPINYHGSESAEVLTNIFQKLLDIDFRTTKLVPVLAESRPEIEVVGDSTMRITYMIRKEAKWDNGQPVLASDVAFTIKVVKNPKVDNQNKKPYIEFINAIELYEDDARKFTFVCKDVYIRAEYSSGAEVAILPEYLYDPNGLMKDFTIRELSEKAEELAEDPKIIEFAREFNSEKWQREPANVQGSGAYKFDQWKTGQRIVLTKKANWWGSVLESDNTYFEAKPNRITYQIINDITTAVTALKAGELDVLRSMRSKDFVELRESEAFQKSYNGHLSPYLAYAYLGLNTDAPHLSDKRTRQALAHIVDVDRIIETIYYGFGKRTVGTLHTSNEFYDHDIVPYPYSLERARSLLGEVGWGDADGDGTLDMETEGEHVELIIHFSYVSGNPAGKSIGLILQESARRVGIVLHVEGQEGSNFIDNRKRHDFDMFYSAWVLEHAPDDPAQLFSTGSANGGSNFCSFGNEMTDALIDSIGITLDETVRKDLWYRLQEIIHDEVPYIFLMTPMNKLIFHQRFDNAYPSAMSPGYWAAGFTVGKPN